MMPSTDELQGLTPADRDPVISCDDCDATLNTHDERLRTSDWFYHEERNVRWGVRTEVTILCPDCRDDGGESA